MNKILDGNIYKIEEVKEVNEIEFEECEKFEKLREEIEQDERELKEKKPSFRWKMIYTKILEIIIVRVLVSGMLKIRWKREDKSFEKKSLN